MTIKIALVASKDAQISNIDALQSLLQAIQWCLHGGIKAQTSLFVAD